MSAFFCLFLYFRSYSKKLEVYNPIFFKIRYILEELYVAVIWIISRLIIYIDQLNTGLVLLKWSKNWWELEFVISRLVVGSCEQDNTKEKLRGCFCFFPFKENLFKGGNLCEFVWCLCAFKKLKLCASLFFWGNCAFFVVFIFASMYSYNWFRKK